MSEVKGQNLIKRESPQSKEITGKPFDAILVFGQGPVIDEKTRVKAKDAGIQPGSEDINLWSKSLAESAAKLYEKGETREIIVMGGKTGGDEFESEADLIAKELRQMGVPEAAIKLENESTNTLENLVNMLNKFSKNDTYKDLGLLGSNYHLSRLRLLMSLFDIKYKTAFSSEEVLRYGAREKEIWDDQKLLEIENRLNMAEASKTPVSSKDSPVSTYYSKKEGIERKNVNTRAEEEDIWSRALLEMPEYWLKYLGRLEDGEKLRQILQKQDKNTLKRFGLDLSESDASLKEKLLGIERKMPNVEEWRGKVWPISTTQKLEEIRSELKAS